MAPRSAKVQAVVDTVKPSGSTVASIAGGAIAVIVLWVLETYVTGTIPAHVASAFTTLATVAAGYKFLGGRSVDTQD